MQSLKNLMVIGFVIIFCGVAIAAPTTDLPSAPKVQGNDTSSIGVSEKEVKIVNSSLNDDVEAPPSSERMMQEHILQLVEDDYRYQSELRKLKHQVELEKMLSEIRKLRGEDKLKTVPAPVPVRETVNQSENNVSVAENSSLPHVVLESVIGGLSRVAIADQGGNQLLYVQPGETFAMDGKEYILTKDKKLGLQIKEVNL
ncbi:hypothetical protein CA284_16445 [Enterobacter mori]|uniref:hypothetical protein n=1 Tax=Enterobacter mori TaxID=539813 RepID=UPI000B7DDC5A|nr:hypothetical protein [Enterobacter mori]OXL39181.1 hypothetical protein CA284_16445 [Enterobacter mori]